MIAPSQCDVVSRASGFEKIATGQVVTGTLADACNWAVANGKRTVGVEGAHDGLAFCGDAHKSSNVASNGTPLNFYGLAPDAMIRSSVLWQTSGIPGFLGFYDLTLACKTFVGSDGRPACDKTTLLFAQNVPHPFPGAELHNCLLLSSDDGGASGAHGMWDTRPQGQHYVFRQLACKSPGPWKEHAGSYADNTLREFRVEDCYCEGAGRTGTQTTLRQFNDAAHKLPTGAQIQALDAICSIKRNVYIDCAGYIDPVLGATGNGSTITVAGFIGASCEIIGNTVRQTFPSGGAVFVGYDAKQGSWTTPSGHAVSNVKIDGNVFHGLAGAHAQRELVMLGSIDKVRYGSNLHQGSLVGLCLDHTGPMGDFGFTCPTPSASRYWQNGAAADVVREIPGQTIKQKLSSAQIDALYTTKP